MTIERKTWMSDSVGEFLEEFVSDGKLQTKKSEQIVAWMEERMARNLELSETEEDKYALAEELLEIFFALGLQDELNPPAILYEIIRINEEQYGEAGKRHILRYVCRILRQRGITVKEWLAPYAEQEALPAYKRGFIQEIREYSQGFSQAQRKKKKRRVLCIVSAICVMVLMFLCGCMYEHRQNAEVIERLERENEELQQENKELYQGEIELTEYVFG